MRRKHVAEPNYKLDSKGNPIPAAPALAPAPAPEAAPEAAPVSKPFDPTTRCQHCGDLHRNHTRVGRYCKPASYAHMNPRPRWTPWTLEEYAAAEARGKAAAGMVATQAVEAGISTLELRSRFTWARPWNLATRVPSGALVELTSYPWTDDGGVSYSIMARLQIGDATTNTQIALHALKPLSWTQERVDGYREGFMQGWHCAAQEARDLASKTGGGQ